MTMEADNWRLPGGGIHHIAVQTHDLEGAVRLYRDVLGMRIVKEGGTPERRITLLDTGDGSHVELISPTGAAPSAATSPAHNPLLHVALTTTDLRRAVERVRSAGYEITVEPKEVQPGPSRTTIAFFKGPSGELVEFIQTD
ncbi:MAG: lactoylglutathione lyase-like [Geobacteraceae bacterium]|nr:MAG: lactoylglutathione lyase-like [Geobacteraceae bacterium]